MVVGGSSASDCRSRWNARFAGPVETIGFDGKVSMGSDTYLEHRTGWARQVV
jgi:hypothetical protein